VALQEFGIPELSHARFARDPSTAAASWASLPQSQDATAASLELLTRIPEPDLITKTAEAHTTGWAARRSPDTAPSRHPSQPQDPNAKNGYVRQDYMIQPAEQAGFKLMLMGTSEINANPKDQRNQPVWNLPPTLRLGQKDRQVSGHRRKRPDDAQVHQADDRNPRALSMARKSIYRW
jgi:hypothetical protein